MNIKAAGGGFCGILAGLLTGFADATQHAPGQNLGQLFKALTRSQAWRGIAGFRHLSSFPKAVNMARDENRRPLGYVCRLSAECPQMPEDKAISVAVIGIITSNCLLRTFFLRGLDMKRISLLEAISASLSELSEAILVGADEKMEI